MVRNGPDDYSSVETVEVSIAEHHGSRGGISGWQEFVDGHRRIDNERIGIC